MPALVWIHGGGYMLGAAMQDRTTCRRFVQSLGCIVVAVDYRLAPEHPFPAALDDCYSALLWTAELAAVDPARVAIAGASAGGGLAAAVALRARDHGQIAPVAQVLVYPMLDDRTSARPDADQPYHRIWGRRSNALAWSCYLGDAGS